MEWIKTVMLSGENNISESDLDLIKIVDTAQQAFDTVDEFYKSHDLSPNF